MTHTLPDTESMPLPQEEQATETKRNHSWNDTLRTLIIAVLLAMTFRSFLYEPFHIPSGSMKSTLLVGDYLFVSKYSYGYSRYSFPFGLPLFEGRIFGSEPKRGDIIVFRLPYNPKIDYIKRLVGLPGDTIQMREGVLYINGAPVPRERTSDYSDEENVKPVWRYKETLPGGKVITIMKTKRYGDADDTPVFVVPEKHYFFMGDNRDNSRDSRFMDEVGFVPEENIVGKAEIIFCSVRYGGSCFNPINWFAEMRYDRFFKLLH